MVTVEAVIVVVVSLFFDDGQAKEFCKDPQSKKKVNESFILIVNNNLWQSFSKKKSFDVVSFDRTSKDYFYDTKVRKKGR